MHNLVSTLPHRLLREMAKKYGPLMHLQLGEVSVSCLHAIYIYIYIYMIPMNLQHESKLKKTKNSLLTSSHRFQKLDFQTLISLCLDGVSEDKNSRRVQDHFSF